MKDKKGNELINVCAEVGKLCAIPNKKRTRLTLFQISLVNKKHENDIVMLSIDNLMKDIKEKFPNVKNININLAYPIENLIDV